MRRIRYQKYGATALLWIPTTIHALCRPVHSLDTSPETVTNWSPAPDNFSSNNPENVVGGDDEHEEDEEDEADGVYRVRDARFNRAAGHTLDKDEKEATAVERRDGDEVDEREVDGNNRHNREEIAEALERGIADDARDTDRSRDLREVGRKGEDAGKEVEEADCSELRHLPG